MKYFHILTRENGRRRAVLDLSRVKLYNKRLMPEVFVFVPSYNHAPFVERCLQSIIKQTLAPKKLFVIDDGSKDNSARVIEKALKDCPFPAELIARENRGLCATLNEGFSHCDAEFFAYLGSDDLWLPEFTAARAELLTERQAAALAYGHAFFIDLRDEITDSSADHEDTWADYPDGDALPMLLQGLAPISSTVFYRSALLAKTGWNEDARLEDYEMYLKLAALGEFAFDRKVLSAWRHHDYNTSRDMHLMLDEVVAAQKRNFPLFGMSEAELNEFQAKTKFIYAKTLLQHGEKKAAIRLARECWRGAKSKAELAKFLVRLGVPMSVVATKRKFKHGNNRRIYGKITV